MNVFQTAGLFLNRFNEVPGITLALGDAQFIRLEEDEIRQHTFLDHRAILKPVEAILTLDEFIAQAAQAPQPRQAFGMIYHSAFCGSTYLARCLDATGIGLSLKEPYALTQSSFHHADETYTQFSSPEEWEQFLGAEIRHLSRPGASALFPVIKTHNICVVLANQVANLFPSRARSVFIYSDLKSFLVSVLKNPERRQFCKFLVKLISPSRAAQLGIPWVDSRELPDAQVAVYCWMFHMAHYRRAAGRSGNGAFCSLNCEQLLDRPLDTLLALARFFGVETGRDSVKAGLQAASMKAHAKDPTKTFSAQARRTDLETEGFKHRKEVKLGLRWFEQSGGNEDLNTQVKFPLQS
ncbi:MAG TPA: hypothetical protein VKN35_05495 [Xanthomonadales bacterium]|nr:hypothetical protein [Xanthomonadales bacterium]